MAEKNKVGAPLKADADKSVKKTFSLSPEVAKLIGDYTGGKKSALVEKAVLFYTDAMAAYNAATLDNGKEDKAMKIVENSIIVYKAVLDGKFKLVPQAGYEEELAKILSN